MMPRAAARLDRWLGGAGSAGPDGKGLAEARDALDDDLDTPGALAAVDDAVARGEGVFEAAALLGVDLGQGPAI
jgi:L-cysteine:1D-myo-inositol 2-amino-2-deoxy-alpha-D-glucopyranoside ligase